MFGWFDDWVHARARREETLRRLGGPDVVAERKKKEMTPEGKFWTTIWFFVSVVLAFGIWRISEYKLEEVRHPGPDTAEVLACVNSCATACVDGAEP